MGYRCPHGGMVRAVDPGSTPTARVWDPARDGGQFTVKLTGPDSLGEWAESPLYFAAAVCFPAASLIFTVTLFEATGSGPEEAPSTVKTTVPVSGGAPTVR